MDGFAGTECVDRTVTRPCEVRPFSVTGIGEAKPHRKVFPGGRQVRGKTRLVDRSAGQAAPSRLASPAYQTVHRCESQAAQELTLIH